ncbi:hypothetical protein [Staphylococcus simulans]|uniref:hypothetical protein n=1 Tax=Staphylococcus simulans TaxID=1286 RepID=UPI003F80F1E3
MNRIKSQLLDLLALLPYVISAILVFYVISANDHIITQKLDSIQDSVDMSDVQINLLIVILIVISSLVTFFVTYFLLKLLAFVFKLGNTYQNKSLYMSLLLGFTIANVFALIFSDLIGLPLDVIKYITPLIDIGVFAAAFYFLGENKGKTTPILVVGKLIINLISWLL